MQKEVSDKIYFAIGIMMATICLVMIISIILHTITGNSICFYD